MAYLERLQDEKNQVVVRMQELGKVESMTAEQSAEWDRLNERFDAIGKEMAEETAARAKREQIQQRLAEIDAQTKEDRNGRRVGIVESDRKASDPEHQLREANEDPLYAIQGFLRAGKRRMLTERQKQACERMGFDPLEGEVEIRSSLSYGNDGLFSRFREVRAGLDVATSGAGKETIPAGFFAELDRKMLAYDGARQVARVINTPSGNSLPWPKVDDTGNTGALLAEATTIGTSVDPTFSAVTLGSYKFSSKAVLVSAELLEDSAFNLSDLISGLLAERLGRVMATYDTTGTGSGQPEGIVAGSAAGKTAASATAFTPDEMIDLMHSVDIAYRNERCGFMMHDTILKTVRKFKDNDGQYIWQPGLQLGAPDRLFGYPVVVNNNMDSALTTGKKLILFGDFSHFVIRDVGSTRFYRLDELYRGTDQTGFVALRRMDSKMIQSAAVKHLVLA